MATQVLDNLFDDALQFLVAERLDDLTSSDPLAAQGAVDALARCIADSASAIGKMGDASGLKTPFSQAAAEEAAAAVLVAAAAADGVAVTGRRQGGEGSRSRVGRRRRRLENRGRPSRWHSARSSTTNTTEWRR